MASYVRVPKHLLNLPAGFKRGLRKGVLRAKVKLENAVVNSIKERWNRTGASAEAAKGFVEPTGGGNYKVVVRSGKSYDVFGEYGTGTRGAENAPSFKPAGWTYGKLAGMKPRMAFHVGAETALEEMFEEIEAAFADEMNG